MGKHLKIISDLDKNSQGLITHIKEEANTANFISNKVAYAKDTSAMYSSIKSCYNKLSMAIENSAQMKRTLLSFERKDYDELYDAPLLYQSVEGSINAEIHNKIVSGNLHLYNRNGYTSWNRQQMGVEANIIFSNEEKTYTRKKTLTSQAMCLSLELKTTFELEFNFNIGKVAEEMGLEEYEAVIILTPFIEYAEGTMYFTEIEKTLSYIQHNSAVYDNSNNFKIITQSNDGVQITDYANSSVSELTIPNIITREE